jgi:peptidoglycan/xylan/chitin deacetylase (PgdA/CDA1 family)
VNKLMLTFDDGPDPTTTPRLLDLLADAAATATFFVIAPRAEACAGTVARMIGDGHAVGLHCDEHVRHSDRGHSWVAGDTVRALQRLQALGVTPELWRTPWGVTAPWTASVATEHGLDIVGWTVDTHDWRGDGAESMFAATRDRLTPEAIVLAHDGIGPGALREDARQTLDYVGLVLAHAQELGLPVASI